MPGPQMPTVALPDGSRLPVLGQGTWGWAEDPLRRSDEIAALNRGLDEGMTLVDTAEMYADGDAEELVGEAIAGRRDEVFLVSKVLPGNASRKGTVEAAERSLRRLHTDRLDLYLLHWRGPHPLADTLDGFHQLQEAGKIRRWGVSNLDVDDLAELVELPGGADLAVDQVLYNPTRRGPEWDLLPWCREHRVPVMAYSPIEQGRLLEDPGLADIAAEHHASPAQVALAWVISRGEISAIPRAGTVAHVQENRAALDLELTADDLDRLDRAFPSPDAKQPLEVL